MKNSFSFGCSATLALALLVSNVHVLVAQDGADSQAFKFSVKTGVDYTDNNESQPDALKQDNITYRIGPRVDVYINGQRTVTDFYYSPTLLFRSDASPVENDEDVYHILGIALDHNLSRKATVRVREEFVMTDDPAIGDGGSVRRDQTHYINHFSPSIKYDINRKTYVNTRIDHDIKRFDDKAVADESDEDRISLEVMAYHTIAKNTAMNGRIGYTQTDFESKTFGIKRGSDVIRTSLGGERALSPTLRVGANFGVDMVDHEDPGLGSETEPYGDVNFTVSPSPAVRFNGTISHGVREADVFPFSSQTFTEFRGRADVDASEVVTVGVKAVYRESEYDQSDLPTTAPSTARFGGTSGEETTTVLSAHAEWKVGHNSKVRVAQLYEDVDSNVETTFTKNTSTLELLVDF